MDMSLSELQEIAKHKEAWRATPSSILAWNNPQTGEPGRLQSTGLQKVRHDSVMEQKQQTRVWKGELQTLNGWDCQKSFKNWSFIKSVMLAAAYRQQEIREQTGRLVRRLWSVIQAKDGAFQISEWQWEWWEGVIVYSISCVQLFATPWTVACQALLSMGYRRQEYWSVLLFLSSGDLPKSGIESTPPAFPGGFFTIEPQGKPRKELVCVCVY